MRKLLAAGVDVNCKDAKGVTPVWNCIALREQKENDSDSEEESSKFEVGHGVKVCGIQKKPELNDCIGTIIGEEAKSHGEGPSRWPVLLDGESTDGILLKAENLVQLADESLDVLLEARAD